MGQSIWVVRPGRKGAAKELFFEKDVVALRDDRMDDLMLLQEDRDTFKIVFQRQHPESTSTAVKGIAGKFFRFAHEMEVGEYVLCPLTKDRVLHVGVIQGPYRFVKRERSEYPHQRNVKWVYEVPFNDLSQAARYELGAARTLFSIKTHRQEILKAIEGMRQLQAREKTIE